MPGQPSSRQNLLIFHRRGAFQAYMSVTPGARRSDAHAGALLYMYVKAPTLRYDIWGTPRVIRNEKMQNMLTRASADSTPILTDQQPSSGSFGQTIAVRVSRRVENTSKGNMCRPGSLPMRAVRGIKAVGMYSPGTLSRGTEAAARFILSIQRASPIPKKRIGLALGE